MPQPALLAGELLHLPGEPAGVETKGTFTI
jgi:hypothetical protein